MTNINTIKNTGNSVINNPIATIPKNRNISLIPIVKRIIITTIAAKMNAANANGP